MNTQKSVFKKLSAIEKVEDKVELSEERVELALVDDLKKGIEKAESEKGDAFVQAQRAIRDMREARQKIKTAESSLKPLEKIVNDIKSKYDELGISIDTMTEQRIKSVDSLSQEIDEISKIIERVISSFKS